MSKVRFTTWYPPLPKDVLYAREKGYKDYVLYMERKKGKKTWDCALRKGDAAIKEYQAKTSKEAEWIARKEIERAME